MVCEGSVVAPLAFLLTFDKMLSSYPVMNTYEQIAHSADISNRLQDYMVELDNTNEYIAPSQVVNRLAGILARYHDAKFELKCRQADLADELI